MSFSLYSFVFAPGDSSQLCILVFCFLRVSLSCVSFTLSLTCFSGLISLPFLFYWSSSGHVLFWSLLVCSWAPVVCLGLVSCAPYIGIKLLLLVEWFWVFPLCFSLSSPLVQSLVFQYMLGSTLTKIMTSWWYGKRFHIVQRKFIDQQLYKTVRFWGPLGSGLSSFQTTNVGARHYWNGVCSAWPGLQNLSWVYAKVMVTGSRSAGCCGLLLDPLAHNIDVMWCLFILYLIAVLLSL